jgi:hypothetical protein
MTALRTRAKTKANEVLRFAQDDNLKSRPKSKSKIKTKPKPKARLAPGFS